MKNWACAALLLGTHCDSHYEYRIGCEDMMHVIWSTDHAAEHALTETALHQMHKCCDAVSNWVNCSAGCCHHVLMPCIAWKARRVLCNVILQQLIWQYGHIDITRIKQRLLSKGFGVFDTCWISVGFAYTTSRYMAIYISAKAKTHPTGGLRLWKSARTLSFAYVYSRSRSQHKLLSIFL